MNKNDLKGGFKMERLTNDIESVERINKHSVLKSVRENKSWLGYIAPSKIRDYHIEHGWMMGKKIIISMSSTGNYLVREPFEKEVTPLDEYLSNFKEINCNSEHGHDVRFWNIV